MPKIFPFVSCLIFLIAAMPSKSSENRQFILPVACTPGMDCWVVNYVDTDPTTGAAQDFKCRTRTYDGHKGTDFALRDMAAVERGVAVLAAKGGTVMRTRDGESDSLKTGTELETIRANTKECGNGILLDHGNGLQTMYCHMKNGSITVKPGERVETGDKIGEVGRSGIAEFPHLHFGVIRKGGIADPFTGRLNTEGCDHIPHSMWRADTDLAYEPMALYDGGFAADIPDFEAVKAGTFTPPAITGGASALVFWFGYYGSEKGDRIEMSIRRPDGRLFVDRTLTQDRDRARQFYYTGRKLEGESLLPGTYTGTARVIRPDKKPVVRTLEKTITAP